VQSETPVLAFFTDARSGQARRMESLIAQLGRKHRGRLRTMRIDVTERPVVAQRLKVETVPTLLLIKDKRVVGRLEGRVTGPQIERMLDDRLGGRPRRDLHLSDATRRLPA
jgi:thioredoxin-like negative regulator of GroEL